MNAEIRRRLWLASTALLAVGAGTGIYLRDDGSSRPQDVAQASANRRDKGEIEQPVGVRPPQQTAAATTAERERKLPGARRDKDVTPRRPKKGWKRPVVKKIHKPQA